MAFPDGMSQSLVPNEPDAVEGSLFEVSRSRARLNDCLLSFEIREISMPSSSHYRSEPPKAQGLYRPDYEHDACGVGFICHIKGVKSHKVVTDALQILMNLTHRGACGCDPETGDGAGMVVQMPDKFLRKKCGELGIQLPSVGDYACGLVFLPTDPAERKVCEDIFEKIIVAEGQNFLGWRDLKCDSSAIGETARKGEPAIRQIFIGRAEQTTPEKFGVELYVIRKLAERTIANSELTQKRYFYLPSLSQFTLIYKGLLLPNQIVKYYKDLDDPDFQSAIAMVHQRFSTNTFPSWELAHPFRYVAHNGEINTVRGNQNWMRARERLFKSPLFGDNIEKIIPVIPEGMSDSASFDCALELLHHTGRSLPHAVLMMIPAAWDGHETMPDDEKAFYEYHSYLMEPWDGPASITFTDGTVIGAVLDRNGLRPSRFTVTKDDFIIMGSETGVLPIDPSNVVQRGRLQPGRMFLVDTAQGRIIEDAEIKRDFAKSRPWRQWLNEQVVKLDELPHAEPIASDLSSIITRQQVFGYTLEDVRLLIPPMATTGMEAIGSMGNDTPLAVLSNKPQLLYSYFKQLFAQVTNPPLDGIREEIVTSSTITVGAEQDLFEETPEHCHQLFLEQPILTNEDIAKIRALNTGRLKSQTISAVFDVAGGSAALKSAIDRIREEAHNAVAAGIPIIILSDRAANDKLAPIPGLLAVSAVHHHLIREKTRTQCGIILESGEPREVHHFCCLHGYGCSAVNPYLALETLEDLCQKGWLKGAKGNVTFETAQKNFIKSVQKGVLKVLSKMGISTLQSYHGAQIFEAIGLDRELVADYFTYTPSRLGGIGLEVIAEEVKRRHSRGYPHVHVPEDLDLETGGLYQWRRSGEFHAINPEIVAKLQHAVRSNSQRTYDQFAALANKNEETIQSLRGLLDFKWAETPIPLSEVEPASEILKRFATGAMSLGSISREAHETVAIAMNRMGGKSNTGEGGEDAVRYVSDPNGDSRNSAIKQVASGRFGVTSEYLVNARELQIKMAQGAKPGEGGQLPGHKVDEYIGRIRNATPGVGLISPPPHHDIYSIEDLAQLIHDLKNSNPEARVSVKLVSEVGVGTVASGVSKAHADVVLISGYEGGTGASPLTSIKHAGIPWELGLAETHQTLVLHNLRSRIVVQTDGQIKTGRDVAIAALLGAEEFGIATAALVAAGCIMMRVCHLNTCPVGIATQDPRLRERFSGKPEHVVNYFTFVAEELRQVMAKLGCRTINEMVGRVDKLDARKAVKHWKADGLDLTALLYKPEVPDTVGVYCQEVQDHGLKDALDNQLIEKCQQALEDGTPIEFESAIRNVNRTVGTMLGARLSKLHGGAGLPHDTIKIRFKGSCGNSFAAFLPKGITFEVEGEANDYFGKGLSGGYISIRPWKNASYVAEENIIIGNVACYGATGGEVFIRGVAGERFCVRNSGVDAVVEGVGDHGCEYMTRGNVVIIGSTGRNFAAGMSGGLAYVLDEKGDFRIHCNQEMVDLDPLLDSDVEKVQTLLRKHIEKTDSERAQYVLENWDRLQAKFIKVYPKDFKRVLSERKVKAEKEAATLEMSASKS
ncbi:MAG: glutamate synthase large subunit [Planctomycetaceae bacterium]|nr:glutamate synthase large subunit [Planctomycetaceae bacterium]